ncbi:DUF58 domain-containing protein [Nocardioides sp. J2M5]|uniref:DUF58 domain-containing protein n=1 Tax=Nocardioides palaemonis TaxID=2829810 RepID=UPI001BA4801E|nr:DUF58 domain-containing protein [Nocardioides palaemonis]MBS2938208.1 DUF58 domain-containing protein [Nocardioides palaemonis]
MSPRSRDDARSSGRLGALAVSARRWPDLVTPLGRGVLLTGVVTLVVATTLNWQEFVQLGVAAIALVVLGLCWQALPGAPTASLVLRPSRLVEGGPTATAEVRVHAGAVPMLFPKVVVPVGPREVGIRLPFLGPYADHAATVALPALPRGVHPVGPVAHEKADPVGMVSRRVASGVPIELFVAPRVVELAVFAGGLTNDLDGATSQQLSMNDLAFHALREYAPGDDLRHVHWRSSAKAGELLVRQYHETRRGHVTILLDDCADSYTRLRDFELAVSVAASVALRAVRDDFDTYLRCGPHVARGRSAAAMTDASCRFVTTRDDAYAALSVEAAGTVGGTGLVVQVTGARRAGADLHAAVGSFGQGVDRLVLRADSEGRPATDDTAGVHQVVVPDLGLLPELMARGRR